jgi:cyclopropane fatty-acyl-phospholipid synthase-like methyltransferase
MSAVYAVYTDINEANREIMALTKRNAELEVALNHENTSTAFAEVKLEEAIERIAELANRRDVQKQDFDERIAELENVSQKLIENSVTSEHYPKYLDELEKLLTKGGAE